MCDAQDLTTDQVCTLLAEVGLQNLVRKFVENQVTGSDLIQYEGEVHSLAEDLEITKFQARKVLNAVQDRRTPAGLSQPELKGTYVQPSR